MNSKPDTLLHIAPCTFQAARFASQCWHYSKVIPGGKLNHFGVWEQGEFKGAIIFGCGANNRIGSPFGLDKFQVCELVRVALKQHDAPVSKIVSIALRQLKKGNVGLKLVVSYADPLQGHVGGIYQAGNWIYIGKSQAQRGCLIDGKKVHKRTVSNLRGSIKGLEKSPIEYKLKYVYPLDRSILDSLESMRKPYPKRACSTNESAPAVHAGGEGSTPIHALQSSPIPCHA